MQSQTELQQTEELKRNIEIVRRCGIEVTYCESFDETSSIWCLEYHSHHDMEMIYFRSGNANIEVSSENLIISPYDVVLYPADATHKESLTPMARQEIICIRLKLDEPLAGMRPLHVKDRNQMLGLLFRKIHESYHNGCRERPVCLMEDYARLLLLVCLESCYASRTSGSFIDITLEYLADHFREKITVPMLAELVHVSTGYLSKCFQRRVGMSIIRYINRLRIEEARHMLVSTDLSVEQITAAVGINSPKYFYRMFKRYVGESPSEFRRNRAEPEEA